MSIASEIQRLSGVRSDIFTSITNKGVTVPPTATFSSCPSLIDSITGGGGGSPTSLINNTFTASGYLSAYRPFTATQNEVPVYDDITYTGTIPSYGNQSFTLNDYKTTADSPQTAIFIGYKQQWATVDQTTGNLKYQGLGTNYGTWSANVQSQFEVLITFDITAHPIDTNQFYCDNMSWAWGITSVSPYSATYREQTGTNIPYPNYPTTTTGYSENIIDLKEKWDDRLVGNNLSYVALLSSNNTLNIVYDDSPSNTSVNSTNTAEVSTFSSNMLKNKWGLDVSTIDTNYTYNYGTLTSGYSGFEGI